MNREIDNKIGIISIGIGNTESVASMLNSINVPNAQFSNPTEVKFFSKLILPGVGHFGAFIDAIDRHGFRTYLNEYILNQKLPILGLCVGAQAMLNSSEEDVNAKGLGWIKGSNKLITHNESRFIPRVGWDYLNLINHPQNQELANSLLPPNRFYFTHSYKFHLDESKNLIATSKVDKSIPVVFMQGNVLGVQFHPEKSQSYGFSFLDFFSKWRLNAT